MSAIADRVVSEVMAVLRPERAELLGLLESLRPEQWALPTECPAYAVKDVAAHLLGDDLSLLSRQRDAEPSGLLLVAGELPGADLRTLLDAFNDRWVSAAAFLSPPLIIDLLRLSGEQTAAFYETVDLTAPGEPVGFFASTGDPSPWWQALAREYVERWVHHSQVRRATGSPSLAEQPFVRAGVEVVAAVGGSSASFDGETWSIGAIRLGSTQQAADLLTRAHTAAEVRGIATGPAEGVDRLAIAMGRDTLGAGRAREDG